MLVRRDALETATAVDTISVSASRVVEAGSPCFKEPALAGEWVGGVHCGLVTPISLYRLLVQTRQRPRVW